jgi:hypothetical protein
VKKRRKREVSESEEEPCDDESGESEGERDVREKRKREDSESEEEVCSPCINILDSTQETPCFPPSCKCRWRFHWLNSRNGSFHVKRQAIGSRVVLN